MMQGLVAVFAGIIALSVWVSLTATWERRQGRELTALLDTFYPVEPLEEEPVRYCVIDDKGFCVQCGDYNHMCAPMREATDNGY